MAASENLTLLRMLVVLAMFVPVMLTGLYYTDVKKHGIFAAPDLGVGRSADEMSKEFDPNGAGAHAAVHTLPEVSAATAATCASRACRASHHPADSQKNNITRQRMPYIVYTSQGRALTARAAASNARYP
jgi:hypothetical protein